MKFPPYIHFIVAELSEYQKAVLDTLSITAVVGTLISWLPSVAASVSIVWGLIRIYETNTVQSIIGKQRAQANNKKENE